MGKRNDNGLWTVPGGHLDRGECPYQGAARELKEEAGLDAKDLKLVKVGKISDMMVYVFKIEVDIMQAIDVSGDPDKECDNWEYIDPNDVREDLHIPLERNCVMKAWLEL